MVDVVLGRYRVTEADQLGLRLFSTTPARQADITLTVDGKEVTVPQGMLIILSRFGSC